MYLLIHPNPVLRADHGTGLGVYNSEQNQMWFPI